jgi:hypothetical protein
MSCKLDKVRSLFNNSNLFSPTIWLDEPDSTSAPSERSVRRLEELNTYSSTRWDVILNYKCFSFLILFYFV